MELPIKSHSIILEYYNKFPKKSQFTIKLNDTNWQFCTKTGTFFVQNRKLTNGNKTAGNALFIHSK